MDIIIGSGSNRQKFTIATGEEWRKLAKQNPVEHAKIRDNIMALVRKGAKT